MCFVIHTQNKGKCTVIYNIRLSDIIAAQPHSHVSGNMQLEHVWKKTNIDPLMVCTTMFVGFCTL